jgi:menaquinol-cytochrome c reductase cytochrome b/c subunit
MSGGAPVEPAPVVEVPVPVVEKPAAAAAAAAGSKIPEALLRRSAEAKAKATGRPVEEILAEMSGGAPVEPAPVVEVPVPVVEKPAAAAAAAAPPTGEPTAPAQAPTPAGDRTTTITAPPVAAPQGTPEGVRPQRLLTVVRAKAIQQVKAEPTDKVSVWPHLLLIEFVALLGVTAFLTVLSVILQAPLLDLANFNLTPNPSKAPWYFLGLQELLSYFDPQIGGVTVPGVVGLLGLMAIPYVDRNPSTKPSDRKFAIMFFTFFLVASATLTMLGTLFRGPGFNFSYPWSDGIWFDDLKDWISFE